MTTIQTSTVFSMELNRSYFQTGGSQTSHSGAIQDTADNGLYQFLSKARQIGFEENNGQVALARFNQLDGELKESLTYEGRPISELGPDEAAALIGPGGYFSVENTSERIAAFVLQGAGEDLERLRSGREGVLKGFKEAEKAWGGKLPGISYETLEKALEAIEGRISELGGSILDVAL